MARVGKSIDKLMQITGKAAILAAHECAFIYTSGLRFGCFTVLRKDDHADTASLWPRPHHAQIAVVYLRLHRLPARTHHEHLVIEPPASFNLHPPFALHRLPVTEIPARSP